MSLAGRIAQALGGSLGGALGGALGGDGGRRVAAARQSVRVVIASLAAFLVYHAFNLPQGYWAVFTVVIVMQASIGGTLSASADRMKGTLFGAVVGGLSAWLHPQTPVGLAAALAFAVGVTVFAASLRSSLKVAPVTAVIMLISPAGALSAALYRVVEIAIGSALGVLGCYLIFPARSTELLAARAAEALGWMADLLEAFAGDLGAPTVPFAHDALQLKIRGGLTAIEAAFADADRERASRLGAHRFSAALPRTLWRVRNDCVSVSRAVGPMPPAAATRVQAPIAAALRAEAAFMRRCGGAILSAGRVDGGDREAAAAALEAAMEALRRSRAADEVSFGEIGRIFGLAFAIESLDRNLSDLRDRIDEAAASSDL